MCVRACVCVCAIGLFILLTRVKPVKKKKIKLYYREIILHIDLPCISFFYTRHKLDRGKDDMRFYVLFNSIFIISGRWVDDNEIK